MKVNDINNTIIVKKLSIALPIHQKNGFNNIAIKQQIPTLTKLIIDAAFSRFLTLPTPILVTIIPYK